MPEKQQRGTVKKIFRHWKVIYLVCSFVYMGWIIQVGDIEFDRINSQYRALVAGLEPGRINAAAVDELTAECLKELQERRSDQEQDRCSSWTPAVVETKTKDIAERRALARKRGFNKVVLFYAGYTTIFLIGPPVFIYLLLVGAIKIYKSVKFVTGEE